MNQIYLSYLLNPIAGYVAFLKKKNKNLFLS